MSNPINSAIYQAQMSTPPVPSAWYVKIYTKPWEYCITILDSSGVEHSICWMGNTYIGDRDDAITNSIPMTNDSVIAFSNGGIDYNISLEDLANYMVALGLVWGSGGYTPWYVHEQTVASTTWTIAHNFDCDKWVVQFYDTNVPANQIHPSNITFNTGTAIAEFTSAEVGYAVYISACWLKDYVCSLDPAVLSEVTTDASVAVCVNGEDKRITIEEFSSILPSDIPCVPMKAWETIAQWQVVRMGVNSSMAQVSASYIPEKHICDCYRINSSKSLYETFTATRDTIESAEFYVQKISINDTTGVIVELYEWEWVNGTLLATASLPSASLDVSPSWEVFDFGTIINVTVWAKYTVKVKTDWPWTVIIGYVNGSQAYPMGSGYEYNEVTEVSTPFFDIPFIIHSDQSVPEWECCVYLASASSEILSDFFGIAKTGWDVGDDICVYTPVAIKSWLMCNRRYYLSNTPWEISLTPWTVNKLVWRSLNDSTIILNLF